MREPFAATAGFEHDRFAATAATAVRMLDDVLDVTVWPLRTSCIVDSSRRSVSFASSSPRVNLEPTSGARSPASRR